jgi:hypothetical protein
MRRTLTALAAAGLLAVTGCSDSDSGGSDAASGDDAPSGGDSTEEFCTEFQELGDRFNEDPEAAADMAQVIEALESLDPPEEIAEDFQLVIDVAQQSADVDPDDEEAVEDLESLSEEAGGAQERVGSFIDEECGTDIAEDGDGESVDEPTSDEENEG